MAEASSKRQKAVESDGEGGIDRISGLPDSVLCHILSFLPTKTCVCTMSLVSRRWRHLWEHLQVFDFFGDYNEDDGIEKVKTFAFFVNAVLTLRRSCDILQMHLYCCLMEEDEFSVVDFIDLWVRAAIGPRLEELHLLFPNINEICTVLLPYTLLNCSNLVSLSLWGAIHLNVQHSSARIYFPSLKKLCLHVHNVDSIDALLSGCPILETLDIFSSPPLDPWLRFCVPPSLKRLEYNDFHFFTSTYIDIDAPCLEYLSITKEGTLDIAVGNMRKVVEACIDVSSLKDNESVNPLLNLLCAISETKHLTLCSSTTKKSMSLQLWEPQSTRIPNCLVSHLTSIHIKGYYGLEEELTFVEYILQNALVLKTIIIKSDSSMSLEEKLSILKKIVNIPRGSNLCQVEFD